MKKDIKSDRTRLVFAETAKEMIRERGIESITVRNIAEKAGYVIRTLYNHFNNLDELLWMTRSIMIKDISESMNNGQLQIPDSVKDIIVIFQKYAQYFIDNPEVYRFLYFKTLDKSSKKTANISESEAFNIQLMNIWTNLINKKLINPDKVSSITKVIIYSIHGLLTLSLSTNDQLETKEINGEIEKTINFLLLK